MAAAERTHRLAIEHAKTRVQFGHAIGSYQAVQHRTVNCAIEIALSSALVDDAVRLDGRGDPTAGLALEMAVEHALDRASWVQFEAHHTLAASGFFDRYPAPWLFRRVHSDLARIPVFVRQDGTVADEMIARGVHFPNADLGEAAEAFRERLRADFDRWQPTIASGRQGEVLPEALQGVVDQGLVTLGWPEQYGGSGASIEERAVLAEEVGYKRLKVGSAFGAATLLGNSIIAFGTEEQKAKYLPLIAEGRLHFYLGYSEPEAGSDLASLQLSAVRDGDEWVLNGTKRWGQAQHADWGWIAARTDPDAKPRHAGISVFLVPLRGLRGFRIEEITSLAGETHAFSHFEDVRVPADALIGELNGGWKVISAALAEERITMAGIASGTRGLLDVLMTELDERGAVPPHGGTGRARLGRVATRLQGARVLTNRSLVAQASGVGRGAALLEAPLAKIVGGEATEEFSKLAVDLLGPDALLDGAAEGSIADGHFDYALRISLIGTVGGGTGDIQRNLIARALGLPRE
jgi:alkylation response protein AidB-like acyl-CoA dehydrogenase